ncbi:MAG: hypothetical protein JSR59_13925 [Proteobacteria bacterium]|nr:hypothetical protein [Pseudomonadota bacterium]
MSETAAEPSLNASAADDPWNNVVAALGGSYARIPARWPRARKHRLLLPEEMRTEDIDSEPTRAELEVLCLVSERPRTAAELAAALHVELRVACTRIARMRIRGLIERTGRGWQAVAIGIVPAQRS